MSRTVQDHIAKLVSEIDSLEAEISDKKKLVNSLCELEEVAPRYHDVEKPRAAGAITADAFYGKPLATVARTVLEMKGSAIPVNEIYETMIAGGYQFESKSEDNAKRVLRISLSKNNAVFHKLPNGTYGLRSFYPALKPLKATEDAKRKDDGEEEMAAVLAADFSAPAETGSGDTEPTKKAR